MAHNMLRIPTHKTHKKMSKIYSKRRLEREKDRFFLKLFLLGTIIAACLVVFATNYPTIVKP